MAIERFQLPDRSGSYAKLVDQNPAELDQEQLYNRVLSLWNTPFRELRIPTSMGDAHIIVSGDSDKPALVLLHGMNTNSTMWYPNVQWLSRHYQVYAIDYILGPGKSKPSAAIETVDQVVAWYAEVFKQLELSSMILAGASQGGWFATRLAVSHGENIGHLVLLSPAQTFNWVQPSVGAAKNILFALSPERSELRDTLQTLSTDVDGISQLYIDQFYRITQTAPSPPLVTAMTPFADEDLQKLTMPTLLLIGDQDIINSPDSLERARELLPCVDAEQITDTGHFLSSDSASAVNQRIHHFLEKHNTTKDNCTPAITE